MNATLALRRVAARLPYPVRKRLGRFRAPIEVDEDAVDAWTTPAQQAVFLPPARQESGSERFAGLPVPDLRCLLITDALDTGGLDEVVAFLARRLPSQGIRVAVLHAQATAAPLGRLGQKLKAEGVEVVGLTETDGPEWIRSWQPDVISAHGAPNWALATSFDLHIPVVETLHGMHDFANPERLAQRKAWLSGVVAVSDLVLRQYHQACPAFDPDFSTTIPNGVDAGRLHNLPREAARSALEIDDEFLFVSLSRHSLQKNTYGLVTAFLEVAQQAPSSRLLIAGRPDPGDYPTQVRRLQRSSPLRDRVWLMDAVAAPSALLAAADAFVLNSFFEGWALSSMEAMSTGLPVIISEVGGAAEQLAGRPDRGKLVTNPAGDPAAVDWETISSYRFRRQPNRAELVSAMLDTAQGGQRSAAERKTAAAEAIIDFSAERCLAAHASVLRASADGRPIRGIAGAR